MSTLDGNVHVRGRLSAGALEIPSSAVTNAMVVAGAGLSASKLQHQHTVGAEAGQANGTDVVTRTDTIHIVRGTTGLVYAVEVASAVAPDGDADFYTVQINRIRAAASVNVLSAVITYNNTNAPANYDVLNGTIDAGNDDLQDGDVLQAVITVTNNGGAQAQGLILTVTVLEDAN